jgi:permuted papain-like amidase YaeF/Yiix C92 family enzyme
MKKGWVIGGAGALVVGAVAFVTVWPGKPVPTPKGAAATAMTSSWIETVRQKGKDGYWLVVRGSHIGDQAVAAVSGETLSHAAVLDHERGVIIEAIAKGVVETPLAEFLAQAWRLEMVEPPDFTADAGRAALARARSHLGAGYDWLGLVGAQNDHRFYCTELAVDAWEGRKKGWTLGNPVRPEDVPALGHVVFDSGPRK